MTKKRLLPTPQILRELRIKRDVKQRSIAKYLGVAQQTYSNYEKGLSAIPLHHFNKLCDYFGVSADFLLGRTTYEQTVEEIEDFYLPGVSLGEVCSRITTLSLERRKQMIDHLSYLLACNKEDMLKCKIDE